MFIISPPAYFCLTTNQFYWYYSVAIGRFVCVLYSTIPKSGNQDQIMWGPWNFDSAPSSRCRVQTMKSLIIVEFLGFLDQVNYSHNIHFFFTFAEPNRNVVLCEGVKSKGCSNPGSNSYTTVAKTPWHVHSTKYWCWVSILYYISQILQMTSNPPCSVPNRLVLIEA